MDWAIKTKGYNQRRACALAGIDPRVYKRLWHLHRKQWPQKGLAGWSVAHLLTRYLGWTAYAVIDRRSPQFDYYLSYFTKRNQYPVWRQPNITIKGFFIAGEQDAKIEALLTQNPFSWGFSEGGIHTWITTGRLLKECHFDSGPSKTYDVLHRYPLFETTPFVDYDDYTVHLLVFPPKIHQ